MTDNAAERHLVLGGKPGDAGRGLVALACAQTELPVPYDPVGHTYLTALATCADCLVVHSAWHVLFTADW